MKSINICLLLAVIATLTSCEETQKQDNTTGNPDTMVIKENVTDDPTNTITTDTTRR